MAILKLEIHYDTDTHEFHVISQETGEVKTVSVKKTTRKKKEESSEPQLILEENKYTLNTAAKELLGVEEGDKIDIKYKKINNRMTPIIGSDKVFGTKSGCKLSKNGSVSCRGSKHDELIKYGSVFTLTESIDKGLYILCGNTDVIEESKGDENVSVEGVDENLTFDADLTELIDDIDTKSEEIDGSFFTFN